MTNLFRQAKQLLDKKNSGAELTEEEQGLVNSAEAFAINLLPKLKPEYDNLPVLENLEELARIARMVEEAKQNGAVPRRDQVRAVSHVR